MPEATPVQCPLDDCEWTHLEVVPDVDPDALGAVFGPGIMRQVAAVQSRENIETELRQHFASHDTVDYLRTITRTRADNVRLAEQMRVAQGCAIDLDTELTEAVDKARWLLAESEWKRQQAQREVEALRDHIGRYIGD